MRNDNFKTTANNRHYRQWFYNRCKYLSINNSSSIKTATRNKFSISILNHCRKLNTDKFHVSILKHYGKLNTNK
jgi:hypothetical protein